jgi:hypothetical protein
MEKAEKKELMYDAGKYAFYVVIVLSIFLFIIKPLLGMMKGRGGPVSVRQVKGVKDIYVGSGGAAPAVENAEAIGAPAKGQPALVSALQDKALVKTIIKEWVREGA